MATQTEPIEQFAKNMRIAIISSGVPTGILDNVKKSPSLNGHFKKEFSIGHVLDLPMAAKLLSRDFDVIIAIGLLKKDEKPDFDAILNAVHYGLIAAQIDTGVPIIDGVVGLSKHGDSISENSSLNGSSLDFASRAVSMGEMRIKRQNL